MKFLKDLKRDDLEGKNVLIRVGMDVPIVDGAILDDWRIHSGLDSINHVISNGAKAILLNHIGRPKGWDKNLSNKTVAEKLSEIYGDKVKFIDKITGEEIKQTLDDMEGGHILVLENIRFHEAEEKNDDTFAKELASLGDVYVNDAFSVSHRQQASVHAIAKYLPSYAGLLLGKEINHMNKLVKANEHPFVVVLGGKKVSDKLPVIEKMIGSADTILIGGAMAYTFLKARGDDVDNSIVDNDLLGVAKNILEKAKTSKTEIVLPTDSICNDDGAGCDIGTKTLRLFKEKLKGAALIFWNGPMGIYENKEYSKGTEAVAKMIADSTATTVIGGGDTLAAIKKFDMCNAYTHMSTGGGASMEFISGKTLPGIAALNNVFDINDLVPKRRIMIAGNWKMNKTIDETIFFSDKFRENLAGLNNAKNVDVVICAPYTCLHTLIEMFADTRVMIGAEDMHWEDSGAFTGEISGAMLKDIGCTYVILGHSERRQYFGELNKTINLKIKAALRNDLTPIVCIGETLEQREDDKTLDVLRNQFERCFNDLTDDDVRKIIIAYEPVWAIGTGRTATPEQAQEIHAFIRSLIKEKYKEAADVVRILYGGSMKAENASALTMQQDVDGGLVGGASLNPDTFTKLIESV